MKKVIILLACLAVASASQASFELMLVAEFGGPISRFDALTGTSFGSFGAGQLIQPYGIAVNPSRQECYVADAGQRRIVVFNYNTGEYLREIEKPTGINYGQVALAQNGDLLLSEYLSGSTAKRISAINGAVLATYNPPTGAGSSHGILEGPGGEVYVGWNGIEKVARYTNSGGNATSLSAASATTMIDAHQAARSGNQALMALGNQAKVLRYTLNGSSATIDGEFNYSSEVTRVLGVAMGHGELAYVSGNAPGGARTILQINRVTGAVRGKFTSTTAGEYTAMAVVTAPEPAGVTALVLGLAVLVRRRR